MMQANIPTTDLFGITDDPQMPFLAQALDPLQARRKLERHRARLASVGGQIELRAVRVARYKPGRRCLIEHDVAIERPGAPSEALTLVGKARARGLDSSSYQLLASLYAAGFGADSCDGICVPEPIGTIPEFQMWLQRKVPG